MSNIIRHTHTFEQEEELKRLIKQKQAALLRLTERVERLKIELLLIKREYDRRIGILYMRIQDLDRRIDDLKRLTQLVDSGLSIKQAEKQIKKERKEDTAFYEEYVRINQEQQQKESKISDQQRQNFKFLWKELVRKFHPDLVQNEEQKKEYTLIMKRINKAYVENDINSLEEIAQNYRENPKNHEWSTDLESMYKQIQLIIKERTKEYRELKKTEWYTWKENLKEARKDKRNLFSDLEVQLQEIIEFKTEELQEYQKNHGY